MGRPKGSSNKVPPPITENTAPPVTTPAPTETPATDTATVSPPPEATPPATAPPAPKAPAPRPAKATAPGKVDRSFSRTKEIVHDLFKLDISNTIKNLSFRPGEYQPQSVPHIHFFHSVDNSGRKQEYCNSVGGHFHKVDIEYDENDNIVSVKSGPPLRWVEKKLRNGKILKKAERIFLTTDADTGDDVYDTHTHKTFYLRSDNLIVNSRA